MEGHAETCVERYCESAQKDVSILQQPATPCIDDHLIPPEDCETTRELSTVCAQIVLVCVYLARPVRPDFLWSVNTLARSVTKWSKACDKRLLIFTNYINQTKNCRQSSHVGDQIEDRKLCCFQDASFAGDLRDSKSTSGGLLCVFGAHTFVPISWMCKKQTAVSHRQCRVWHYFARRRFTYGWITSSSIWGMSWKHFPVSQPRGTYSLTRAKETFRLMHILTLVFLSQVTTRSTKQTVFVILSNPTLPIPRPCRQWCKWSTKDEARNWKTSPERTESIWMGCLADNLTKRPFTTRHSRKWIWIVLFC